MDLRLSGEVDLNIGTSFRGNESFDRARTAWSSSVPETLRSLEASNVRTLEVPLMQDSMALHMA